MKLWHLRPTVVYVIAFSAIFFKASAAYCLSDFTIPESKLLGSEFSYTRWGGSVSVTDEPGQAVKFSFTGLSSSGTGLKDDYPADTVYGQILPSHGNGNFSNFGGYSLRFENLDNNNVSVSLFMNTGFTGPSGTPSSDLRNDTFWQSGWTEIGPGQTKVVRLDFNNAIPWNISDNPSPHTQGTDGIATAINSFDRTEVSAIGFEVSGPAGNSAAALRISPVVNAIEMKGVSYTPWSKDVLLSKESDKSLSDARNIGCNWIALCVWWFQDNVNSTVIEPDYTRYSASPESIVHAIKQCHKLGMKVMLKPMVDCRDGSWRGYINPSSDWFNSYRNFINFWADIAESSEVELYCIGCELNNTESSASSWQNVISETRNCYNGPLTYAANHGRESAITWWGLLDYIGIDAYYALTTKTNPTLAELKTAWKTRADSIESWRNTNWSSKDVIFTEVGYQSVDGTNKTPWWTDTSGPLDLQEQADCYEALLSQCKDRSWWRGAFWWNWETDPNAGGPADKRHLMQNKPAEEILRKYYTVFINASSPNDPGSGIGDDPFRRIQDAINYASANNILLVSSGLYKGVGNRDLNFQGKKLILKTSSSPSNVIIDCNGSQTDPHRSFFFHSGEDSNSMVQGFWLTKGWVAAGGPIMCQNNSSPTFVNCIIAGNTALSGGAICCIDSSPLLINDTVAGNNCSGVEIQSGFPQIVNSILYGNHLEQIAGDSDVKYSNIEGGYPGLGNIDCDPCFASFDANSDPNSWDFHLQSQAGRWDTNSLSWILDSQTSRCIDAGQAAFFLDNESQDSNNVRINMGAYGDTTEASKTPAGWGLLADLNNDGVVNFTDYAYLIDDYISEGEFLIGDVTRDGIVDLSDCSALVSEWLNETIWSDL